jgi:CRP-like cAMP-binding protein
MTDAGARRISRELFLAAAGERLRNLDLWVIDRLTAALEEDDVRSGDRIFSAGDSPDYFYFLRQGRVELKDGHDRFAMVDGPCAFGMLDALVERPRLESAFARGPVQLVRIRMDAWLELLEDSFALARTSVLALARAVAELEERVWTSGRRPELPRAPVLERANGELDVVDRLAILMHVPPLRGAGVQPLSDLAMAAEEVAFVPGQSLFARGSRSDRVFVLVDGRVEATREDPTVSWRGGPGEIVCGVASLAATRTAWEAHAVTRVRALSFGLEDWFDEMEENFDMVRATMAALATERDRLLRSA